MDNGTSHNLQVVTCGQYVEALEQLVRELGSDPDLALSSCVAGTGGERPADMPEPRRILPNTVTWREVVEETLDKAEGHANG